ncbi:hypothetical protein IFM89_034728 [Coptis chinensis]|uniref:3-hydroxyisobutyryl-CoA hydrolase n=1 Tax=Coptis chinensis TaxID=261450 RepID=A0A835LHB4_9MAGN|nr:hypothetical protein IFM89_034728 [Coptis chinensis]
MIWKSLKPLSKLKQRCTHYYNNRKCFSALPNYYVSQQNEDIEKQVLVQGYANARVAALNRPSVLNAISTPMAARLNRLYESWEENPDMKGSGRSFCAGGDVVSLYHLINQGFCCLLSANCATVCKELFGTLYKFIYLLGTYLKPHVAILDGITMGGGAGISLPGTFRAATDNTV